MDRGPATGPGATVGRHRGVLGAGIFALRPWRVADAPALAAMRDGDPDVVRFTPITQPYGLGDAEATIRHRTDLRRDGGGASWAIVDRGTRTVVGDGMLTVRDGDPRRAVLGYLVERRWRGRGAATAALVAIRDHAFALGFTRLDLEIDPDNAASIRVAERAGFALERVAHGAAVQRGELVDLAHYTTAHPAPPAP